VFGILQLRPLQEGLASLVDCIGDGALRVHSHDFQGEKPKVLPSLVIPGNGLAESIVL
jgi:hypothetical protein